MTFLCLLTVRVLHGGAKVILQWVCDLLVTLPRLSAQSRVPAQCHVQVMGLGSEGEFLLSDPEPCLCHVLLSGPGRATLVALIVLSWSVVDTNFSDSYILHITSDTI